MTSTDRRVRDLTSLGLPNAGRLDSLRCCRRSRIPWQPQPSAACRGGPSARRRYDLYQTASPPRTYPPCFLRLGTGIAHPKRKTRQQPRLHLLHSRPLVRTHLLQDGVQPRRIRGRHKLGILQAEHRVVVAILEFRHPRARKVHLPRTAATRAAGISIGFSPVMRPAPQMNPANPVHEPAAQNPGSSTLPTAIISASCGLQCSTGRPERRSSRTGVSKSPKLPCRGPPRHQYARRGCLVILGFPVSSVHAKLEKRFS